MGCCGRGAPAAMSTSGEGVSMPLRQLKHKVGDRIFETKQDAFAYAAENGGVPEKVIVETNQFIQADPTPEESEALKVEVETEAVPAPKKGPGRPRKS